MWRTSSYSETSNCVETGSCPDPGQLPGSLKWRTSSYSMSNGQCVQVAPSIFVRDSKDQDGPVLSFSPSAWAGFTERIKENAR